MASGCRLALAYFCRRLAARSVPLSGSGSGRGAHLSAGQQQLLALARALVHRPAVLLFDEATAAIDNASDAQFRAALRDQVLPDRAAVLTVGAYLASRSVASSRIEAVGKGESDPIATNDTEAGRQQNRRVELVVSGDVIGAAISNSTGTTPK